MGWREGGRGPGKRNIVMEGKRKRVEDDVTGISTMRVSRWRMTLRGLCILSFPRVRMEWNSQDAHQDWGVVLNMVRLSRDTEEKAILFFLYI